MHYNPPGTNEIASRLRTVSYTIAIYVVDTTADYCNVINEYKPCLFGE